MLIELHPAPDDPRFASAQGHKPKGASLISGLRSVGWRGKLAVLIVGLIIVILTSVVAVWSRTQGQNGTQAESKELSKAPDELSRFTKMMSDNHVRIRESRVGQDVTVLTMDWPTFGLVEMTAEFRNGKLETAYIKERIHGADAFAEKLETAALHAGIASGAVMTLLGFSPSESEQLRKWFLAPVIESQLTGFGQRVTRSINIGPAACSSTWALIDAEGGKTLTTPRLEASLDFRRR